MHYHYIHIYIKNIFIENVAEKAAPDNKVKDLVITNSILKAPINTYQGKIFSSNF